MSVLGKGTPKAVTTSTAWDALAASLRELDAKGIPVEPALPQLVASRPFQAGDDPAAVVHFRLQQWAEGQRPLRLPERIVGIILRADYTAADTDMRGALDEREAAMLERASAMLDEAIAGDAAWLSKLTPTAVSEHRERLLTIAAYRDWYGVGDRDPRPLGDPPASSVSARADWSIAVSAWKNIVPTTTSSPTLTLNHDDEVPSALSPRPTR